MPAWFGFAAALTCAAALVSYLIFFVVERDGEATDSASDAEHHDELIRRMLDVAGQSGIVVSEQMTLVALNDEAVSLLQLLRRPTPGVPLAQALADLKDAERLESTARDALTRRTSRAVVWPNGRAVEVHCNAWRSPTGERYVQMHLVSIDETDSIDVPLSELKRSHPALEAVRVPMHTAPPSDDSVQFLAGVSHDLRAPLVTIRGLSEMMALGHLGELNPRQQVCQEKIVKYLDHVSMMLDHMIDFSRLSARDELDIESFDLADLAHELVEMHSDRADARHIHIALRREVRAGQPIPLSRPFQVLADRLRVHQVLANLLDNAIKFTPDGGKVRVYIRPATSGEIESVEQRLERASTVEMLRSGEHPQMNKNGGWVLVRVQDTGQGIPDHELPLVFERFYTSGRGSRPGTGLGLAITDGIVKLHSGIIEVHSQVGVGTSFSVWLPIFDGAHEAYSTSPAKNDAAEPARALSLGTNPMPTIEHAIVSPTGSVWVVDDDPDCCEMARMMLQARGHRVETMHTVHDVKRRLADEDSPYLLLLDFTLEGMDGLEMLKRFKADANTSRIPVVMVSGYTDPDVQQACLDAGALGFLTKPYSLGQLHGFVDAHAARPALSGMAAREAEPAL